MLGSEKKPNNNCNVKAKCFQEGCSLIEVVDQNVSQQ